MKPTIQSYSFSKNSPLPQFSVDDCEIISFDSSQQDTHCLVAPIRNGISAPFQIRRMYYIYDIPLLMQRGGHAHKNLHQIAIAISGSFSIKIDDGQQNRVVTLNSPNEGLHLVPGIWREVFNFAPDSICIVFASEKYDESDYIREYEEFLIHKNNCFEIPDQPMASTSR